MHVVIYEGSYWKTFAPLSLSRPVFMLASGAGNLLEKQLRHLKPTRVTFWVRSEFEEYMKTRVLPKLGVEASVNTPLCHKPALMVSGRTLHLSDFRCPDSPAVSMDHANLVTSAYVVSPGLTYEDVLNRTDRWLKIHDLPRMDSQSRLPDYLWDLIKWNDESLLEDFTHRSTNSKPLPQGAYHVVQGDSLWLGESVDIQPGVVLDASKGPILLDDHASIGANSVLQGPCYIGKYANLRPLTIIRPGTSIGMMCKIGGEVSNSIVFGFSNKAHDGYLGDSYVGKWANLGALTTTSNLKNTYGSISMHTCHGKVDTGRRFLGSLIGDHAKTAILTRLMSGTYIGFGAMVATSDIPEKLVPSFAFWSDKGRDVYDLDRAMAVMRRVFARRDRVFGEVDEQIVRYAAGTAPEIEAA